MVVASVVDVSLEVVVVTGSVVDEEEDAVVEPAPIGGQQTSSMQVSPGWQERSLQGHDSEPGAQDEDGVTSSKQPVTASVPMSTPIPRIVRILSG